MYVLEHLEVILYSYYYKDWFVLCIIKMLLIHSTGVHTEIIINVSCTHTADWILENIFTHYRQYYKIFNHPVYTCHNHFYVHVIAVLHHC